MKKFEYTFKDTVFFQEKAAVIEIIASGWYYENGKYCITKAMFNGANVIDLLIYGGFGSIGTYAELQAQVCEHILHLIEENKLANAA